LEGTTIAWYLRHFQVSVLVEYGNVSLLKTEVWSRHMYGNIFPGYFLSEVMHHERGRNTLELREGRNKMPNTV